MITNEPRPPKFTEHTEVFINATESAPGVRGFVEASTYDWNRDMWYYDLYAPNSVWRGEKCHYIAGISEDYLTDEPPEKPAA